MKIKISERNRNKLKNVFKVAENSAPVLGFGINKQTVADLFNLVAHVEKTLYGIPKEYWDGIIIKKGNDRTNPHHNGTMMIITITLIKSIWYLTDISFDTIAFWEQYELTLPWDYHYKTNPDVAETSVNFMLKSLLYAKLKGK